MEYDSVLLSKRKLSETIETLDPKACKVLLFLLSRENEEGEVSTYPKKDSKLVGMSQPTYLKGLKNLMEGGYLRVIRRTQNKLGTVYRVSSEYEEIEEYLKERFCL